MKKPIFPKDTATVEITKGTHARMKIHVAKLGMKIKCWLDRVISKAITREENE